MSNTTRRELIAGGLAAALLPKIGESSPVRSMLGAMEPRIWEDDIDPSFSGLVLVLRITPDNLTCGITFSGNSGDSGLDGVVDWGDGVAEPYQGGALIYHQYARAGDYVVKADRALQFAASTKSQVFHIVKWGDGLSTLSPLSFRNLANVKTVAGNNADLGAWTFASGFKVNYGNATRVGPFPNTKMARTYLFIYCYYLKTILLDGVLQGFGTDPFAQVGRDLVPDSDGFKTHIRVANTCCDLLSLSGFPGGAPTATLWICSDGEVAYRGGKWDQIN